MPAVIAVVGRVILASGPWIRSLLVLVGGATAVWAGWPLVVSVRRWGEQIEDFSNKTPAVLPFEVQPDPTNPEQAVIVPRTSGGSSLLWIVLAGAVAIILIGRR